MLRRRLAILVVVLLLAIGAATELWITFSSRGRLIVSVLDIGQGDAILVTAPSGERIVIDGGPDNSLLSHLRWRLGLFAKTIDLVVLTHPDADHVTGLSALLDRYDVKRVMLTGIRQRTPEADAFHDRVLERAIPIINPLRGMRLTVGEDDAVVIDVLAPHRSYTGVRPDEPNETSVVFRLTYGETIFLFTGDSGEETEQRLLEDGVLVRADVLKVGHHGSDTSTSEAFLTAVQPKIAVISVGRDNRFGHPSRRVLRRLERAGAETYRTDLHGTVTIQSDGKGIVVKTKK